MAVDSDVAPIAAPPLALTDTQRAAIRALGRDEHVVRAPISLARQAFMPNDAVERAHAVLDPDGFWAEKAKLVDFSVHDTPLARVASDHLPITARLQI